MDAKTLDEFARAMDRVAQRTLWVALLNVLLTCISAAAAFGWL